MHRYGAAGLLGLAVLGLAPAAGAADIPGNRGTRAVLKTGPAGVTGTFERRGDSDWYRLTLKGGQNYAFEVSGDIYASLTLRNLDGKVLRSAQGGASDVGDGGFEFRSPKTATFLVEFRDASPACTAGCYPTRYRGIVMADARGDTTTGATIAPGGTIDGILNWSLDSDYFRARLVAGRSYTISYVARDDSGFGLVDSRGRVLAVRYYSYGEDTVSLEGVKVPATGTYYVFAGGTGEFRSTYELSLTTP